MVVDYSNASSTMLYDVRSKTGPRRCSRPPTSTRCCSAGWSADEVAGVLTEDAAREVGLELGTKVVVGCGDEHGARLGAGLVVPDLICDITGTAEPVCAAADEPVFDETGLVETHARRLATVADREPGLRLRRQHPVVLGQRRTRDTTR